MLAYAAETEEFRVGDGIFAKRRVGGSVVHVTGSRRFVVNVCSKLAFGTEKSGNGRDVSEIVQVNMSQER